ncbi:hypothetical protein AMJ47_00535 [Parcubacteria bacterium DG_72]|nr:MAG: hypothetical protein AMJ47_00535 [Parcubacteria bacterium DG_72]
MANLIKKVIVLGLLLVAVFAVYLAKNQDLREDVLIRLGLAASKDFKIPEDIKIGMEDINIDRLELKEEQAAAEDTEEVQFILEKETSEGAEEASEEAGEEGVGIGSVEAWEDEPKLSLEEIEEQIGEIVQQVELIRQEVDILVAMDKIKQEIKDLANQAEELNLECSACNILSSV